MTNLCHKHHQLCQYFAGCIWLQFENLHIGFIVSFLLLEKFLSVGERAHFITASVCWIDSLCLFLLAMLAADWLTVSSSQKTTPLTPTNPSQAVGWSLASGCGETALGSSAGGTILAHSSVL